MEDKRGLKSCRKWLNGLEQFIGLPRLWVNIHTFKEKPSNGDLCWYNSKAEGISPGDFFTNKTEACAMS